MTKSFGFLKIVLLCILFSALFSSVLTPRAYSFEPIQQEEFEVEKDWIISAGFGALRGWNWLSVSKEFFLNDHTAWFVTAGLGTIIVGGGVVWYEDRDDKGLVASADIGLVGYQLNLGYQYNVKKDVFINGGISYGEFFMQYRGLFPFLAYEYRY